MRYHINKPLTWCDALRRKLSPVLKEMAWNIYNFFSFLSLSLSLFLRYCCLPWILFTTHHHNHNAIKRSKHTEMKMKVPENIFFIFSSLALSFLFYILLFFVSSINGTSSYAIIIAVIHFSCAQSSCSR